MKNRRRNDGRMRCASMLLSLAIVSPVFSFDPSSPKDGNLYRKTVTPFKPAKAVTYPGGSVLAENGLSSSGNRIFRKGEYPGDEKYRDPDLHVGSGISASDDGYSVTLTGNTDRYGHAIFGSGNNATGFTVFKDEKAVARYEVGPEEVIETKRALIAEIIPENEGLEILLTVSHAALGSRVDVFSFGAKKLGSTDAIGVRHRWLHVLAVAPFALDSEPLLALVRTPHIGGVLQFYAWNGEKLEPVSEAAGFSTHQIGSDDLNMAIASDFDGDPDDAELMVPSTDFRTLKIVKLTGKKIATIREIGLSGRLATNIFMGRDDPPALWFGTRDGHVVKIVQD